MFTGIIEEMGTVLESGEGRLRVRAPLVAGDAAPGDSIAVNGVDLTVAALDADAFAASLMPETYRRSALGDLRAGDRVNLERSVRPGDRLSGHLVRGVTEGVGELLSLTPEGDALLARVAAPPDLLRYVVVKGPVCVDGVSLTVTARDEASFTVSLVRYTREHTTLEGRGAGARVNLETDIIARYVERFVDERLTAAGDPA